MMEEGVVSSLGSRGEGIVRGEDGKVVFVPGALPGERIHFLRKKDKGRFDRGSLELVLEASADRQSTPCPLDHPAGCGGCQLLHVRPEASARLKAVGLLSSMERLGLDTSIVEPAIAVPTGLSYRNQARFLVGRGGELNFVGRAVGGGGRERRWIKIPSCPILHDKLNSLIPLLRGKIPDATAVEMRVGATTGESLVVVESPTMPTMDIVAFPSALLWISEKRGALPLKGLPLIHEIIEDVRFQVSASSFFQGNTRGAETLVGLVREMSEGLSPRTAVDLHAGVGLFALAALKGVPEVVGVESDQDAVLDFRRNAEGSETKVRLGDATDFVKDAIVVKETPDLVVVDPPRSGLQPALMEGLLRLLPPHIIYVSCAPDALVKDLQTMVEGGYSLIRMVPVDQFAGTAHLEVVTLLRRNPALDELQGMPDPDPQ